jgi:hypothetical protein
MKQIIFIIYSRFQGMFQSIRQTDDLLPVYLHFGQALCTADACINLLIACVNAFQIVLFERSVKLRPLRPTALEKV